MRNRKEAKSVLVRGAGASEAQRPASAASALAKRAREAGHRCACGSEHGVLHVSTGVACGACRWHDRSLPPGAHIVRAEGWGPDEGTRILGACPDCGGSDLRFAFQPMCAGCRQGRL